MRVVISPICLNSAPSRALVGSGPVWDTCLDLREGRGLGTAAAAVAAGASALLAVLSRTALDASDSLGPASNCWRRPLPRRRLRLSCACLAAARWPLLGIRVLPASQHSRTSKLHSLLVRILPPAPMARPRMRSVVLRAYVFAGQVCVHLGRGDAGVSQ